jgi:hypothetical protein
VSVPWRRRIGNRGGIRAVMNIGLCRLAG